MRHLNTDYVFVEISTKCFPMRSRLMHIPNNVDIDRSIWRILKRPFSWIFHVNVGRFIVPNSNKTFFVLWSCQAWQIVSVSICLDGGKRFLFTVETTVWGGHTLCIMDWFIRSQSNSAGANQSLQCLRHCFENRMQTPISRMGGMQ